MDMSYFLMEPNPWIKRDFNPYKKDSGADDQSITSPA
jgi:hypothetical protein